MVAVQVRGDQVELFRGRGFAVSQLGSTYALDLRRFSLAGSARLKLRNRIARARRAGVARPRAGPRTGPSRARAWSALARVSRAWLGRKGGRELDFMVGELGAPGEPVPPRLRRGSATGARSDSSPTCPPGASGPGHLHDLTRRAPDAPAGVMELINATAVARFTGEGARFLHFGHTPFIVDRSSRPAAMRASRAWFDSWAAIRSSTPRGARPTTSSSGRRTSSSASRSRSSA